MTTAREYLDRYNHAAKILGRPTIKAWKSSTAAIQVKANMIEREVEDMKFEQVKEAAAKAYSDTITLATIARTLGLDPKEARAKARRLNVALQAYEVSKHTFNKADEAAIVGLLTKDHRKK